jgi:hypothetical protein
MTFNNTKQETKKIPLMQDEINDKFIQLQSLFLEYTKIFDELIQYEKKLPSMNRKDFDKCRDSQYI